MHNKIEVLSPAGSYESVVAAIANNADAVYIGAKNFSARQNALNFDYDELKQTVEYCHIRGAKVYQAINIIVFDEEIDELLECIKTACEVGIDALIVQDFGVLDIIKKVAPAMPVHISTQMSVHTPHGAALAKKLGAKRIVLARELNFEQIKNIVKSVDIETEVFVHGALCMSVSGQCYMSGMIGGRSGNRGCCAGTCRMPFTSTSDEGHVLSLKDLCLTQYVTLLEEIGVTSLKIEGRMKRPEYVASATKAYDEARKGNTPDTETLKAVFSRSGFTQGYFLDKPGSDMFGIRQKDDVLAATPKVLKELSNTYKKETSRVLISFAINIKKDVPILLSVTDEDNNTLSVSGECPQIALNKAIDEEYVIKSLSKLGSTPFYTNEIVCNIEDGLMVSAGELNALRRQACTQLETMRISKKPKVDFRLCNPYDNVKRQSSVSKIYARFLSIDQVSRLALLECDAIILPINAAKKIGSLAIEKSKIILEPPRVMFGNEKEVVEELTLLKEQGYNKIIANNIAHIDIANELGFQIIGGPFLNAANSSSVNAYQNCGVNEQILSFEMTAQAVSRINTLAHVGVIGYGYIPLMITKNCPIKNQMTCLECKKNAILTDRLGFTFAVKCSDGYTEIFNGQPIYMGDRRAELGNIDFEVLYFTSESSQDCDNIISSYKSRKKLEGEYTRGLYYRKV